MALSTFFLCLALGCKGIDFLQCRGRQYRPSPGSEIFCREVILGNVP